MTEVDTYRSLYETGVKTLTGAGVAEATLDARLLLEYACGITHEMLLAHPEREVTADGAKDYLACVAKRAARVPLAYITGTQEFMGLTFHVDENVLIPNPDTETLVEAALGCLRGDKGDGSECHLNPKVTFRTVPFVTSAADDGTVRILDLCTGSGCVGLSLLHYSTGTTLVATDISEAALRVARENAEALGLAERAEFVRCDLYPEWDGEAAHFDLIVANPPYIATEVIETLAPEVRCAEPRLALDGGADGLVFYRRIIGEAGRYLACGAHLLVETGYDQGTDVSLLFRAAGFQEVCVIRDLAGLDRVVCGRYMG